MYRLLLIGLITLVASKSYGQDTINCPISIDSLTGIEHVIMPEFDPEFPGGEAELMTYLFENLKVPNSTVSGAGTIYVTFFVMSDGSVSNVVVKKTFDNSLSEPVIKLIENMPNWIPGKCGRTPVSVNYTLPITIN